jgi:hypothetical protein
MYGIDVSSDAGTPTRLLRMPVAWDDEPLRKISIPPCLPWQVLSVEQLAWKIGRTSLRSDLGPFVSAGGGEDEDEDDPQARASAARQAKSTGRIKVVILGNFV